MGEIARHLFDWPIGPWVVAAGMAAGTLLGTLVEMLAARNALRQRRGR